MFYGSELVAATNGQNNAEFIRPSRGGAIFWKGGLTVENCEFTGNRARSANALNKYGDNASHGGALAATDTSTTTSLIARDCKFVNNGVTTYLNESSYKFSYGGAVQFYTAAMPSGYTNVFERCVFTNNKAYFGACLYGRTYLPDFRDCVFNMTEKITEFSIYHPFEAVLIEGLSRFHVYNTFLNATEEVIGYSNAGLIRIWSGCSAATDIKVENCTVNANRVFNLNDANTGFANATVELKNTVFRNVGVAASAAPNIAMTSCAGIDIDGWNGEGCKSLADVAAFKACFKKFADGDFTPRPGGPLADAGVNADWMVGAYDVTGEKARVLGLCVDIGSFEYEPRGMVIVVR